jgi:hypothetical protein
VVVSTSAAYRLINDFSPTRPLATITAQAAKTVRLAASTVGPAGCASPQAASASVALVSGSIGCRVAGWMVLATLPGPFPAGQLL